MESFLLTEDGGYLLQEIGDQILLEESTTSVDQGADETYPYFISVSLV